MRICLYTETALPKLGGQEVVVDALARSFLAAGHSVTVLAAHPKQRLGDHDRRLPYHVERHPRFLSTRRFVAWYRYWLVRLHRRQRFDLIHCQSVYPCGYLAALARWTLGVPLVVTSHGGDVWQGSRRMAKPGLRPRHVLAVQAADCLVAISRFTADGFAALGGAGLPIVTIPNGIDREPLLAPAPRPAGLPEAFSQRNYFLFLGRLTRRKGVDTLLRALAGLPRQEDAPRLVVAGDGEQRSALEALAAELNLTDRVYFAGRVGGAVKGYLLQQARALAVPSRDWESFGLVVLESYAAGRPVIASDLPGLADLVRHEETGLIAPSDDAAAWSAALARLWSAPDTADLWGAAARVLSADYAWSTVAARHLELYARLQSGAWRSAA